MWFSVSEGSFISGVGKAKEAYCCLGKRGKGVDEVQNTIKAWIKRKTMDKALKFSELIEIEIRTTGNLSIAICS